MGQAWIQQFILGWIILNICFMPLALAETPSGQAVTSFSEETPALIGSFGKITPRMGMTAPETTHSLLRSEIVLARQPGNLFPMYLALFAIIALYLFLRKNQPSTYPAYERAAFLLLALGAIVTIGSEDAAAQEALPDLVCTQADDETLGYTGTIRHMIEFGVRTPDHFWMTTDDWYVDSNTPPPGDPATIIIPSVPAIEISSPTTSLLCLLPTDYMVRLTGTAQDTNQTLLYSCYAPSHFVDYDTNEYYCQLPGCGNKFSSVAAWDSLIGCCGSNPDDDPDQSREFCLGGCKMIGSYIHLQDEDMRDWDDTGGCCGDDIDPFLGDCMRNAGNSWCIALGGIVDPDRYQTSIIKEAYLRRNPPSEIWPGTGYDQTNDHCDKDNYREGILFDQVYGPLYIEKQCTETTGTNISSYQTPGVLTQSVNLDPVGLPGPYFVEEGNWSWVSPSTDNRRQIYYVSCAGYPVLSDYNEFISCTNQPINSAERSFSLPGVAFSNSRLNPYSLVEAGAANRRMLCHPLKDARNSFMISECRGTGDPLTCFVQDQEGTCTRTSNSEHVKITGEMIVMPSDNSYKDTGPIPSSPHDNTCSCGNFGLDTASRSCTMDSGTMQVIRNSRCTQAQQSHSFCVCSDLTYSCDEDTMTTFFCIDDGTGYAWWSADRLQNAYPKSAFDIPMTDITFAHCDGGTPLLDQFAWSTPGTYHYCSDTAQWVTDINSDEETCTSFSAGKIGKGWTGTRCCGEPGDYPEFYSDTEGACFMSTTQELASTVSIQLYGDQVDYTELLVLEDEIVGCAIARNPESIKEEDRELGVNSLAYEKLEADTAYKGGSRNYNIAQRTQFYRYGNFNWGTLDNNFWMLDIISSVTQTSLITDALFCTVYETDDSYLYCSYNGTWAEEPIEDWNGIEPSHLSFAEWNYGPPIAGCCPIGWCWNGTTCIDSLTDPHAYPIGDPGYICVDGAWQTAVTKRHWDGTGSQYVSNESYCLVDENGNRENNFDTSNFSLAQWKQPDNQNPVWIRDGQYILDHLCDNGTWSTRTKVIADTLLDFVETHDVSRYSLHCDNYQRSINKPDYTLEMMSYSTVDLRELCQKPTMVDMVEQFYLSNMTTGAITSDFDLCYQALDPGRGTAELRYPLVNAICVLEYERSGDSHVIFGVSLNNFWTSANLTFNDVVSDVSGCPTEGDSFGACSAQGSAYFNPYMQSIIYSKTSFSLTPSAWNTFLNFWRNLILKIFNLFSTNPLPEGRTGSYILDTKQFDKLYIAESNGKRIEAVIERNLHVPSVGSGYSYLYASYEGFGANICDSVATKLDSRSECIYNGNEQIIRAYGGPQQSSVFLMNDHHWAEITRRLRLDGSAYALGSLSQCAIDSTIGNTECVCGGEYFTGGSGAFGSPGNSVCCLDGACTTSCDLSGYCPDSCQNPRKEACSCVDNICSGTDKVLFPVRNEAGRFLKNPVRCTGDFEIDVSGANWELSSCTQEEWDCSNNPEGGGFSACPEAWPIRTLSWSIPSQGEGYGYKGEVFFPDGSSFCCDGGWAYDSSQGIDVCCKKELGWPLSKAFVCNPDNWYLCDISQTCGNGVIDNELEECDLGKRCWDGTDCTRDDDVCTQPDRTCANRCEDGRSCTTDTDCAEMNKDRRCLPRCSNGNLCDSSSSTSCHYIPEGDPECRVRSGMGCSEDCRIETCPNGGNVLFPGQRVIDCGCQPGWANCNNDWSDGCETELGTSGHCTSCYDQCSSGTVCMSRFFGCMPGTCIVGEGIIGDCVIGDALCGYQI